MKPIASLLIIVTAAVTTSVTARAADPRHITQRNCFTELAHGHSETFICDYPAWLTDEEKADLKRITREYLQDASCRVSIKIDRKLVMQALAASDLVFGLRRRSRCNARSGPRTSMFPISGTFAPKVVFKDGAAVEASPGLGNVTGVSKYLAWPVIQYVNRAPSIRAEMLKMINDYREISRGRAG